MTDKKTTVGKVALDLAKKSPDTLDPIEIEREMHTDYEKNIDLCIDDGLTKYTHDFYVVVLTKKERLLENVLRNYFFSRSTCPTPEYDQTVYKYHYSTGDVEFLWVIPSKDTCEVMRDYAIEVVHEEKELLRYVLDFYDGSLFTKAKQLNNEMPDSPLLKKGSL